MNKFINNKTLKKINKMKEIEKELREKFTGSNNAFRTPKEFRDLFKTKRTKQIELSQKILDKNTILFKEELAKINSNNEYTFIRSSIDADPYDDTIPLKHVYRIKWGEYLFYLFYAESKEIFYSIISEELEEQKKTAIRQIKILTFKEQISTPEGLIEFIKENIK